jgi:hypothetical protein
MDFVSDFDDSYAIIHANAVTTKSTNSYNKPISSYYEMIHSLLILTMVVQDGLDIEAQKRSESQQKHTIDP